MRPNTILLKDSVITENFILIFQCNGKHFFDINSMINCSFVQNHQRHYTLGTNIQQNHYFRWKSLSLPNSTSFIDISTIYCSYPRSYRQHQCQRAFSPKREFSWCLLCENLFELNLQIFFRLIF